MNIDKYVLSVMVFSICVIIFRSGIIYQKRETLSKNKKVVEIVLLLPYLSAVVAGVVLLLSKEVVL
jgi:NhaP-type Na+/H+ or K+/H+ antiporter